MGELRNSLKQNLNHYLSLSGMTQKDFSIKLGVSQAAVTNWLKGNNSPDIDVIAKICDVLGITINDLIQNSDNGEEESGVHKESDVKYKISSLFKKRRRDLQLSQNQVAQLLEGQGIRMSKNTIQLIESGHRPVKVEEFIRLCEIYNIDANTFLSKTNKSPEPAATDSREMQEEEVYQILKKAFSELHIDVGSLTERQKVVLEVLADMIAQNF